VQNMLHVQAWPMVPDGVLQARKASSCLFHISLVRARSPPAAKLLVGVDGGLSQVVCPKALPDSHHPSSLAACSIRF